MDKEGAERFEASLSMTEALALYGALEDFSYGLAVDQAREAELKGIYALNNRVGVHIDALAGDRDASFSFTPAEWIILEGALRARWQALSLAQKRWDFEAEDDLASMMWRLTHTERCRVMDATLSLMRATGANENDFPDWGC